MKYLGLKKKKVEFVFMELDVLSRVFDLESNVQVLCEDEVNSNQKFTFNNISTLHSDGRNNFESSRPFEFYIDVFHPFVDDNPMVTAIHFRNTVVAHDRVELLVRQLDWARENDPAGLQQREYNPWKTSDGIVGLAA